VSEPEQEQVEGVPAEEAPQEAPQEPSEPSPDEEEAAEEEEQPEEPAEPQEPSALAAVGMSEKELERGRKAIEKAGEAYATKLSNVMGEEANQLETCPRCAPLGFLGFYFPAAPVSTEQKDAVLASVGEQPAIATKLANFARRCDDCDGNGVVLSGSRRNDNKTIRCVTCEGRGYIFVGERPSPVESYTPAVPEPVPANGAPQDTPNVDLWGRPAGHPDYGVHPMYVGQV